MEHGSEPMSRAEAIYEALTSEVLPAYGYITSIGEVHASESVRAGVEAAVDGALSDAVIYRVATEAALTAAIDFAEEPGITEHVSGRIRHCLQMAACYGVPYSGSDVLGQYWPWTARMTGLDTEWNRRALR